VVLFGVVSSLAMLLSTYFFTLDAQNDTKLCVQLPVSFVYNLYHYSLLTGAGCISVAIYIGVFVAYRHTMRQISPNSITNEQKAFVLQRRLTVTLGIITVSTLIFFVIPFSILSVYAFMNVVPPQGAVLGTISRFSTIINVAIFVFRQKEMRKEICGLILCKRGNHNVPTVSRAGRLTVQQLNATARDK
jgi:hypothetical protein